MQNDIRRTKLHITILTSTWFIASIVGFLTTWSLWVALAFISLSFAFWLHKKLIEQLTEIVHEQLKGNETNNEDE